MALPISAQPQTPWQRRLLTPKDSSFDSPSPHPLAYFTQFPALLDERGGFCDRCSPREKSALLNADKGSKAEVQLVGTIRGLKIYDVFYTYQSEGAVDSKKILVRTARNLYREIYHCEPTTIDQRVRPSTIVRVGKELLLSSRLNVIAGKGGSIDDYCWFGPRGPTYVDFTPVREAAKATLPPGVQLWFGADGNGPETLPSMKFELHVWNTGDAMCCRHGIVEVAFKLDRGRVVVTEAHYNPNP